MKDERKIERRICWPLFDKVCLEGGCSYCNDHPFRKVSTIRNAIRRSRSIERTVGHQIRLEGALDYGLRHNFHNAETRSKP